MRPAGTLPDSTAPERLRAAAPDKRSALDVVAVYRDVQDRDRVRELCDRIARSIGRRSFRRRFWSFEDLNEPGLFQEAVRAATDADAMIVSLPAGEKLPPCFCAWIDAWRARRRPPDGTMIALVDVTGRNGAASEHVQKYLRGVALEARLEFLLQEPRRPLSPR